MTSFELISDLHFEALPKKTEDYEAYWKDVFEAPQSDTLLIAGDFCENLAMAPLKAVKFFDLVNQKYKDVYAVAGNHDYMGEAAPYERATEEIRKTFPGVHWLFNEAAPFGCGILFGATFWTAIDAAHEKYLTRYMPDYARISMSDGSKLTPEDTSMANLISRIKLDRVIKQHKDKPIFVLTHHAPSFLASPIPDAPSTVGFCNDLDSFLQSHPQIRVWCHGHVHNEVDLMVGQTRVLANPHGYSKTERSLNFPYRPLLITT